MSTLAIIGIGCGFLAAIIFALILCSAAAAGDAMMERALQDRRAEAFDWPKWDDEA